MATKRLEERRRSIRIPYCKVEINEAELLPPPRRRLAFEYRLSRNVFKLRLRFAQTSYCSRDRAADLLTGSGRIRLGSVAMLEARP